MHTRDRSFSTRSVVLAIAIAVTAAVVITIAAQHALFDDATAQQESDGATVRISALKSESGAVRVALQQQGANGSWGERQHPDLNTVGVAARTGVWLNSSPLVVTARSESRPLYCVIAHGAPDDYFWQLLRGYSLKAEADLNADVRFVTSLDGAAQSAAIDQCVSDGASVIASTLANPDAIRASLSAAKSEGVRLITFNSGAAFAQEVGSEIHIALDETAVGQLAAQTFTQRGVSGDIGCIVHEAANVGLDARCQGLADAYVGGNVHRIAVHGLEHDAAVAALAKRLTDPDAAPLNGLFSLNGDTMLIALDAIVETNDQIDQHVQLGSVGGKPEVLRVSREDRDAHLLFTVNNMSEVQGYLVTAALRMIDGSHTPAVFVQTTLVVEGTPFIFNNANFREFPELTRSWIDRIRALQAAADADEAGP